MINNLFTVYYFFFLSGIYNPCEFEPPHFWGYEIKHKDTPQSVGLLWTSDQPVAETSTPQHTTLTTDTHAAGGIRTRNPSSRSAANPSLRPLGHWDRLLIILGLANFDVWVCVAEKAVADDLGLGKACGWQRRSWSCVNAFVCLEVCPKKLESSKCLKAWLALGKCLFDMPVEFWRVTSPAAHLVCVIVLGFQPPSAMLMPMQIEKSAYLQF